MHNETSSLYPCKLFSCKLSALTRTWRLPLLSFLLVAGLLIFRQPLYPATWFDEGLNLSTAATLARKGAYALPDGAGLRVFDPAIQTGPTVILPIAALFWAFEPSLELGRWVAIVYALIAFSAYGYLVQRLLGSSTALLAIVLLLVGTRVEAASFIYMGRQALGEVPALAFLLLGMLAWLRALDRPRRSIADWLPAGLLWGMAMITKSQVMLLWPVCLAGLFLLDRFYFRRAGWLAFIGPALVAITCVIAVYITQILTIGWDQFRVNAAVLREGLQLHIMGLSLRHWANAVDVLWSAGWLFWGLPGLVWGAKRAAHPNGLPLALAVALPTVGLVWFAVFSVGWGRYAFYTFVLTLPWTADLIVTAWRSAPTNYLRGWFQVMLISGLMAYVSFSGWPLIHNLFASPDTGYLAMRQYLRQAVPPETRIASWEWEFSVDAVQPIFHPSTHVTNLYTAHIWSGLPKPQGTDGSLAHQPCMILVGPFAAWTGLYSDVITKLPAVVTLGSYTLYETGYCP